MSNATIQLQAIGHAPAKPAGELQAGDVTLWNFGATETIVERTKETAKSVWFTIKCESGNQHTRRFLKSRLVGVA